MDNFPFSTSCVIVSVTVAKMPGVFLMFLRVTTTSNTVYLVQNGDVTADRNGAMLL